MTQTEETSPEAIPQPRPKRRRTAVALRAVMLTCLFPVAFALAAAVMLIDRDITAPSWVVERVVLRVDNMLDGGDLRFGAITLRIGRDLHPTVQLIDTQLYDASGLTVTRIPQIAAQLSPRGLILRREMLVQEVQLLGVQINLRRAADGTVQAALGREGRELGQAPSLPALLEQFEQAFEGPALQALETVRADGLIVNFDDARAGRSWIMDGGTVSLDLRGGRTALRGDLSVLAGRAGVTRVALTYTSPKGSRVADIGLSITDAVADDIAAQSPALTWLRNVDAPMTASLRTSLDSTGALGPLSATIEIGRGVLQPNPATAPVRFDAAKTYLTYDPVRDQIAFDQITLETEWGQFQASGQAYLREFRDGLPRALLAQFRFRDLRLNPAGLYQADLLVPAAAIDLRLRFDPFSVDIGQLVVTDGPSQMIAKGAVSARSDGWQVAMDATIDQISPEKLLVYWPAAIKPGTRLWVENNLMAGRLFHMVGGVRISPDAPRQIAANWEFADATVRFMRHLPPITGADGAASFIGKQFVVSLDDGQVSAPQGGELDLGGSVFAIPETRPRESPAVIELRTDSSITAMLSVLNLRPFQFLDKADLPETIADGRAVVTGQINLPLKKGMSPDDVDFGMTADLSAVQSTTLIPGRRLSAPRAQVQADREALTISGPFRVGDVPVTGRWTRPFKPGDGAPTSRLLANIELSQRFLDEFGIALPPGTVRGEGLAELAIDLRRDAAPAFSLQSDLLGLQMTLPAIGWTKAAQRPGVLEIAGTLGAVPTIDSLRVGGGGLDARGAITLTNTGRLATARFDRLRMGDWLDAPVTLRGQGAGQPLAVEIGGGMLDLRRAGFGGGSGGGGPISVALDQLQITEGIALTRFRGDFTTATGLAGQFQAQVNGQTPIAGTMAPRDGRSAIRLRSADAGGAMRAAGFMQNAVGGALDLTLLPVGNAGNFDGTLALRGLRVRDAPTIAALLDAISVVGLLQQLDGQGLAFDEVDARFRLTPAQVIVTEASAVGPGLGISVNGIYTLASKQVDLQGVVSPFYLLNSIGSFLTRKGEGLIGFNFNITGTADAPQVAVNPLSALTPGMFREIFRRPPPELTQ